MSLFAWCTRRSGGLAMIALISLAYYVISKESAVSRHGYKYQHQDSLSASTYSIEGGGIWTVIFAYYSLFIHILVFGFSTRLNWSIWDLTRGVRKVAHNKALKDFKFSHRRRGSATSLSSSETLTSSRASSTSCSEAGDLDVEFYNDGEISPDNVIHAIIIPNYKEETDSLRETLEVLASHPQARNSYDVYLAMEQREANVELKAMGLVSEFVKKFRSIDFTLHPADIPGEAAGKGSNVEWAARKLSERYPLSTRRDVLITGIDADSHLASNYFALVTSLHVAHPETAATTLYSAPIIFDRNAHNVPAIVRVADILWSAAGISGLYRGSTTSPPTSVYTLPLELVDRVGGWDCDNEAIGEDLHMFLKCFFALNGHLTTRTILSPVSQTNVTGGGYGKGIAGIYTDMRARYKQAQRHMWGALDTGYCVRKVIEVWQERKYLARAFRPLHMALTDSADGYVPQEPDHADPEQPLESGIFSEVTHDTLEKPDYLRIFYVLHRVFEAHMLPAHATILIISSTLYMWVTEGMPDVHGVAWTFDVCNFLRTAGFMEVALYLFLYESFHRTCVDTREKDMTDAGLAKGMNFSRREVRKNFVDYFMVPFVAPIYGSIPLAWAQFCHFYTLDLVYTVSKKVTRQRAKSITLAAKV